MTFCTYLGLIVVWFPSAGALQYLYEALISEKDENIKPNWRGWLVEENFSERWGVANVEDLEWDERLLVHDNISEWVKLQLLGRKAAMVQNTLAAKDQEIDTYRADAKNWKDMLEEARGSADNCEIGSKE